jgi:hypothetical protein
LFLAVFAVFDFGFWWILVMGRGPGNTTCWLATQISYPAYYDIVMLKPTT